MGTSAGLSLLLPIISSRTMLNLQMTSLIKGQFSRIVLGTVVFATPGELLFGSILIYYFRLLERQMGIAKFASYAVLSFLISTLLQIAVLVAFPATVKNFASGPYGYIFSSMALVYLRIPRLHHLSLFGIPITDKFFAYLLAAQMAFSNAPSTLCSAIVGIATGCIYHFDVVGLQRFVWPKPICNLAAKVFIPRHQEASISQAALQNMTPDGPAQATPRAEALIGPNAGGGMGMRAAFQPFAGAQHRAPPATPAVRPNEELVQSLIAVTGMSRHQVEHALVSTNNNPDAATNLLLDQM